MSTPVIDPSAQTLYVVTASLDRNDYCHKLHALDSRTGGEKDGSPVAAAFGNPGGVRRLMSKATSTSPQTTAIGTDAST